MDTIKTDILIIGAGPAGLSCGIKLKQLLLANEIDKDIIIIDKSKKPGSHVLSGAAFKAHILDALLPAWRKSKHAFVKNINQHKVERDYIYFLLKNSGIKVPTCLMPPFLRHKDDYLVSASLLCEWLCAECETMGVMVIHSTLAQKLIFKQQRVYGVEVEDGRIMAEYVLVADGNLGMLSRSLIDRWNLNKNRQTQIYSIGVKQLLYKKGKNLPYNLAVHSLGYPLSYHTFGGGFLYSMGKNRIALGMIIGMDWKYRDLDPQVELERFKAHPFIAELIKQTEIITCGAKTIPEGGLAALPALGKGNCLLLGDAAGFVNLSTFKGLHLAMASGLAAAGAMADCLKKNSARALLKNYKNKLCDYGVIRELARAKNFKQIFTTPFGLLLGIPLSIIQRAFPFQLKTRPDHKATRNIGIKYKEKPKFSKTDFVYLSRTSHPENQQSHITIVNNGLCRQCFYHFKAPCISFCPGNVYSQIEGKLQIKIDAISCIHDKSCLVKCPYKNIEWVDPGSAQGPHYKDM